jgi:hypothetical protein
VPSIYAALWSRPSTGNMTNAGRTVAQGFEQLSKAMDAAVKRMGEAWMDLEDVEKQPRLKGVFAAPEYYFATGGMGTWDQSAGNFRSRPIEQTAKESLLNDLISLSKRHPNYVIVPGSVAWKKPLDRVGAENYVKDKTTGLRTTTPKAIDRRTKVAGIVGAPGANQGMGGQRLIVDEFWQAVSDAVQGLPRGTPPKQCPYNLEQAFENNVNSGMSGQAAFDKIYADMRLSPYAEAICAWAGLPPVAVIPKKSEKVNAITSGTATHLMKNTAFVLYGGNVVFKYNKRSDFHESIGDGKTVFMPGTGLGKTNAIMGVTFGLEICLDHDIGMLHTGVGGGSLPNIHIVLSDSVENNSAHMKALNYYLHASTNANETGVWAAPSWTPASNAKLPHTDPADGGTIGYWKLKI